MDCLDDETAALVVTGGLSSAARAEVDAHVDGCEDCFQLLALLAETITPPEKDEQPASDSGIPAARVWKKGSTVGRYVLIEQVGAGGMGTVYAAEDPALARTIAIKLVRRGLRTDRANENLLAEARMMAQLSHPNVVPVYDVGSQDDFVFLAMELIEGANLRQWLGAEKRSWQDIQRVFLAAGEGLVAAHRAGLVHRDFKPDNVLVGKDGRVVVTDFGLAHSTVAPSDRVAGTLRYMAPEQQAGRIADAKSDQFSFAVALQEALTGERPGWLDKIVVRGTEAHPDNRFGSMAELLVALRHARSRRWLWAAVGLAVVAGGMLFVRHETHVCTDQVPVQLGRVWNDQRKSDIQRMFRDNPAAWQSVEKTLDAYAAQWSALHVEACNAPQSAELLDAKVACLGERLVELDQAATMFTTVDSPHAIAAAPLAAKALTPIASCGDARALLAIKPPPPAIAAQVADLRKQLVRAKAMRDAGRLDDAVVHLQLAVEKCETTGYEPLIATALLQLGDAQLANGDAISADEALGKAALAADSSRDDITRARALTRQLYAVGYVREQFDRVAALDAQIASILVRIGGNDELEGDRLQTTGMIALAQRDYPGAADKLARAVALREKTFGPRGRRVAMSKESHCLALTDENQLDAALVECNSALEIWREALGKDHPDVSLALKAIARIELLQGHVDDSCRDAKQALAIEEASLAPDHPTIAGTLLIVGDCQVAKGNRKGAEEAFRRAIDIRTAKLGPTHPKTIDAHARLDGIMPKRE